MVQLRVEAFFFLLGSCASPSAAGCETQGNAAMQLRATVVFVAVGYNAADAGTSALLYDLDGSVLWLALRAG